MAEEIRIVAEPRTVVGKKVKQLRRNGFVPGVVYGLNDPFNVQIEVRPLYRGLRTAGATNVISLQVGDETHMVLAREIQSHLTRRDLLHVDFLEVDMNVVVTAMAELIVINQLESKPVADGLGLIIQDLREVEIEAMPASLVASLTVDASLIEKSFDVVHVSDLKAPDDVIITSDPEAVIIRFEEFREEEVEEVEEIEGLELEEGKTAEGEAAEGETAE